MTTPGSRQAQQNYQQQVQHNSSTFARNAAYHAQRRGRRGPVGAVRRLFGLVCSLVFVAIALGIFLMILNAAQPDLLDQAKSWLGLTF
ncbi:hypothetical protein [Kutzneria kofuensis]|jgi:hypothetical protein|uniref:Uncharacterized protein n=1 Tax=Kutzneria kofuensis TaxID=103725 RepID=A0A7W9KU06_9PSEU|nr:hypothetical protein [Kutzneria kofuensis]MBB5897964.1 hypothetical protein [Kutzneria kofuensis]